VLQFWRECNGTAFERKRDKSTFVIGMLRWLGESIAGGWLPDYPVVTRRTGLALSHPGPEHFLYPISSVDDFNIALGNFPQLVHNLRITDVLLCSYLVEAMASICVAPQQISSFDLDALSSD
jgi:hypothetical protein